MFSRVILILALSIAALPAALSAPVGVRPLLVLGDSLSAAHNMPVAAGWVSLLQDRLKAQLRHPPQVINASVSGETSAGALTRLPALLAAHAPGVVVIELGGNDALRGLSPAQLRDNLERMIVLSRAAGARVLLLATEIPPNYGPAYRERLRAVYRELAARYDTPLVPFLLDGIALRADGSFDAELMQADGIHPTARAQRRVLDNVWPALQPLL